MSRSYHVTEKTAKVAFYAGDIEPAYQASEKSWVKRKLLEARQKKKVIPNRAIVSAEASRNKLVKNRDAAKNKLG